MGCFRLEFNHYSVMLNECIEGLNIREDGIYVDGTLGGAGHTKKILENLKLYYLSYQKESYYASFLKQYLL